jgi:hypothetical protein
VQAPRQQHEDFNNNSSSGSGNYNSSNKDNNTYYNNNKKRLFSVMSDKEMIEPGRERNEEEDDDGDDENEDEEEVDEDYADDLKFIDFIPDHKQDNNKNVRGNMIIKSKKRTTKMHINDRLKQFPNQHLENSKGSLYCSACATTINNLMVTIKTHVASTSHKNAILRLNDTRKKQESIANHFERVANTHTGKEQSQAFRHHVVTVLLTNGIPLEKLNSQDFRDLLEGRTLELHSKQSCQLGVASTMKDSIPFIRDLEMKNIKKEISECENKAVSITFDGTTTVSETYAIVVRFVHNGEIKQRLLKLEFLKNACTADHISSILADVCQEYGIRFSSVIAFSRDRASVNTKAISTLRRVGFQNTIDLECFAHTINNAGEKFNAPTVKAFASDFNNLITRSARARGFFLDICGKSPKRPSSVRWFAYWEQCVQWFDVRQKMHNFFTKCLEENVGDADKINNMMSRFAEDKMLVELAALKDAGSLFCTTLHLLEGDSFLAVNVYSLMRVILTHCNEPQWPILEEVLRLDIFDREKQEELRGHAISGMNVGFFYLVDKFGQESNLQQNLSVFDACRIFNPVYAECDLRRSGGNRAQVSDILKKIRIFDDTEIAKMASECCKYLALASELNLKDRNRFDVAGDNTCFEWWVSMKTKLPQFSAGAFKVALLQPSSACVERVFSLLESTFSDQQRSMLKDAREVTIMLQYHKKKSKPKTSTCSPSSFDLESSDSDSNE